MLRAFFPSFADVLIAYYMLCVNLRDCSIYLPTDLFIQVNEYVEIFRTHPNVEAFIDPFRAEDLAQWTAVRGKLQE